MRIRYSDEAKPSMDEVLGLYRAAQWSSADKPEALHAGLLASHPLVTAWNEALLVGLGKQQALLADGRAVDFYKKLGFYRAGSTEPLWIFDGHEHD